MEFTENERKMIKDARKTIKSFRIGVYLLFPVWIIFLVLCAAGYLDLKTFLYPSIIFIVVISLFPGFGRGPKYADLVNLLESKQPKRKDEFETFVDAIKEVNKT